MASLPLNVRAKFLVEMSVTADTTIRTADSTCWTADGRIICIDAEIFEPLHVTPTPDSVTADSTRYTADSVLWTADGLALGGTVSGASDSFDAATIADTTVDNVDAVVDFAVAVAEVAEALDQSDAIAVPVGTILADVAEAAAALDLLDATVEAATVPIDGGGAYYPPLQRPFPIVGRCYGVLPALWGEAHGVVGAVAKGAAQVLVRAAAVGACGQAGHAAVTLKGMTVGGKGAVGARGVGSGVIMKFSGSASGHHDDDEAAVIAFLLAA
jgi:hypothetical protein